MRGNKGENAPPRQAFLIIGTTACVTDDFGIATFDIQDFLEYIIKKTQTTVYFTVLSKDSEGKYIVKGTTAKDLKKGETYKRTLTISE